MVATHKPTAQEQAEASELIRTKSNSETSDNGTEQMVICDECTLAFPASQMTELGEGGFFYCPTDYPVQKALFDGRVKAQSIKMNDEQAEELSLHFLKLLSAEGKSITFDIPTIAAKAESDTETIDRGIALLVVHGKAIQTDGGLVMLKAGKTGKTRKPKEATTTVANTQTALTVQGTVELAKPEHIDEEPPCTAKEVEHIEKEIGLMRGNLESKLLRLYQGKAHMVTLNKDNKPFVSFRHYMAERFPTMNYATLMKHLQQHRVGAILNTAMLASYVSVRAAAVLDPLTPDEMVNTYIEAGRIAKQRDNPGGKSGKTWKVRDTDILQAVGQIVPDHAGRVTQGRGAKPAAVQSTEPQPELFGTILSAVQTGDGVLKLIVKTPDGKLTFSLILTKEQIALQSTEGTSGPVEGHE